MMLGSIARNLQLIADFQRDCIELATILPYPYEQITEAVKQVAYGSTHPNHQVAGHLLRLIKNKWIVEVTPKALQTYTFLEFPYECKQGCLEKFYALLQPKEQPE
jgi:hypothetical protein